MADLYFNNSSTGNADWSDGSNWWDQPGAGGSNGFAPYVGDTLFFETSCYTTIPSPLNYYITVKNGATLTLNISDLTQDGDYTMQVNVGGVLNINDSTSFIGTNNVDGTINISSSFSGYNFTLGSQAVCNVYNTAYLYPGSFSPGATINVTGTLFLNNYTINAININVTNALLTFSNCVIVTAPTIAGGSSINFTAGSTITTNLTLPTNTSLSISNSYVGTGYTITNNGTASLQDFSGNGAFVNNNSCSTSSSVSVSALTNNGALTVGSGTFGPTIFTNNNSTTVNNNGYLSIQPVSVFTNNGTFNFGSLYSTTFKGRFFPQIPSSASWGNALL
jgi:hypothetical protein